MGRPPKIKKGGLSHEEKGRITYLLHTLGDSPESYKKIAEDLDRPVTSIKKFIQEIKSIFVELDDFSETNNPAIKECILKLVKTGVSEKTAKNKIKRVLNKLTEEQKKQVTTEPLFNYCLRLTNEGDYYVNSSTNGREGITAATEVSSSRADATDKNLIIPPKNPAVFTLKSDDK